MGAPRTRWPLLVAGLAILAAVQLQEIVAAGSVDEAISLANPDLSAGALLRDAVLAVGALLAVLGLPVATTPGRLEDGARRAVLASVAFLALVTVMWVAAGGVLTWVAQEDGLVEWTQTLCWVGAAVFLQRAALSLRRASRRPEWQLAQAAAIGAFLFAGEEISRGQRLFGFESTGVFKTANEQAETTLHNFLTIPLDIAFFTGSVLLLVVLPLVWHFGGLREHAAATTWGRVLDAFMPAAWVALLVAPGSPMNALFWNVLPVQAMLAITVVAVVRYWLPTEHPADRRLVIGLLAAMLVGHLAMLTVIPDTDHVEEYREAIVAAGVLAATMQVQRRAAEVAAPAASAG